MVKHSIKRLCRKDFVLVLMVEKTSKIAFCDFCIKPFANKAALKVHLREQHIECSHCNKMFDAEGLKKHERMLYAKELVNEVGICIFFVNKGHCKFGDECRYSHDIEAFEEGRKMNGACMRHFNGFCNDGVKCRYSHDGLWLLERQDKNGICIKFAQGKKCEYGFACFHSHDLVAFRKFQEKNGQCDKFKCQMGGACKYSHTNVKQLNKLNRMG